VVGGGIGVTSRGKGPKELKKIVVRQKKGVGSMPSTANLGPGRERVGFQKSRGDYVEIRPPDRCFILKKEKQKGQSLAKEKSKTKIYEGGHDAAISFEGLKAGNGHILSMRRMCRRGGGGGGA